MANLTDLRPSKPFKMSAGGAGVDILFDWGSAQRVDLVQIPIHNFPAGADVRWQMHTSNSWAAPTLDAGLTIATYPEDGIPLPVVRDLTGVTGYSASGLRWGRLHIPSQVAAVAIGEIWLGTTKRQDLPSHRPSAQYPEQQPTILRKTSHGTPLRYRIPVRLRAWRMEFAPRPSELALWTSLFRDAYGQNRAFLYWPDPAVNDASMAMFGADTLDPEHQWTTVKRLSLTIEEIATGPAL